MNTKNTIFVLVDDMTHINKEHIIPKKLHKSHMQDHHTPNRVFIHVNEPADDNIPLSKKLCCSRCTLRLIKLKKEEWKI